MNRFRAILLAAAVSAGLPSLVAAQDLQRGGPDREDREQRPDPRGERSGDRGYRSSPAAQPTPQAQPAEAPRQFERQPRPETQAQVPAQPDQRRGFDGGDRQARGADARQPAPGFDPGQRGRNNGDDRREAYRQGSPGFAPDRPGVDQGRPGFAGNGPAFAGDRNYARDGRNDGFSRNDGRFDDRRGDRDWRAPGPAGRVGADWRQDRRYDWRGYRNSHRDTFRIGRYIAPRGYNYGYRPFAIGFRLAPYFYASTYWIDDPYDYRLPPVWGAYRWVRYFDDVLLVDLSTGVIVDSIQGFFW